MTGTAALRRLPVDWDMETVTLMRSARDHSCVETTTVKQGTINWTAARRRFAYQDSTTGLAALSLLPVDWAMETVIVILTAKAS